MSKKQLLIGAAIAIVVVIGVARIVSLTAGRVPAGNILGLGNNNQSQLASDTRSAHITAPEQLPLGDDLKGKKFIDVQASHFATLALTDDGQVYAVGGNSPRMIKETPLLTYSRMQQIEFEGLEQDESITQIASSRDHALALTSKGRVYAWGSNATGQLGDGTNDMRGTPRPVADLPVATSIAAGYRHSVAVVQDGSVYGWGGKCTDENYSAALETIEKAGSNIAALGAYGAVPHLDGVDDISECTTQDSTFVQSKTPVKLNGIDGRVTQVSAGFGHLMALTENGDVYSGGCNTHSQLGRDKPPKGTDGRNDMAKVNMPGTVMSIAAGYRHSLALMQDGTLQAWGYNGTGDVLLVDNKEPAVATPHAVKADTTYSTIEAAHDTSFAVATDGTLVGWGQDDASAFWSGGVPSEMYQFGKVTHAVPVLSAGMQHLLLLEEQ